MFRFNRTEVNSQEEFQTLDLKQLFFLFYSNYWPLFVIVFYILAPVPMLIAKRFSETVENSSLVIETAVFITAGIVVSAYGLPLVLARSPQHDPVVSKKQFQTELQKSTACFCFQIKWGACGLSVIGNTIVFLTTAAYFYVFRHSDDFSYYSW